MKAKLCFGFLDSEHYSSREAENLSEDAIIIFAGQSELVGETISPLFPRHCEWCLVALPRVSTGMSPPARGMWGAEPLDCGTELWLY